MQKITPFLWFDSQAEEAANYYVSIFKNSKLGSVARYDEASARAAGRPEGSVMVIEFELDGQKFIGLNGGPHFKFTEAVSFMINCDSQEEVDYYWDKLSAVPEAEQCGWLKDKFGLSWQVVPTGVIKMLSDKDPAKSKRAMGAVLQMKKIDVATVERAFQGK